MAHRNFFYPPNAPEMDHDQVRNGFSPDARLTLENGSLAFPADHLAIAGVNPGLPSRSSDHPSSSAGVPHHRPLTSGSSSGSSSYAPLGPCYNPCVAPYDPTPVPMDDVRALTKRKTPSVPMFNDPGSASRYYNGGSPQPWGWDPGHSSGVVHGYGDGRGRHAHGSAHLDGGYPTGFPPAPDLPGLASNPRWCPNLPPHAPFGRHPPGGPWFAPPHYASTSAGVSADGAAAVPTAAGEAQHCARQRPGPSHRPPPSYPGSAFTRHPRSLSIGGRSAERSARARLPCGRFQPYPPTDDAHRSRWAAGEGSSTLNDSVGLFDQHRDLRLDVDSMSYEELLALGERIGSVSTGLSEETASKCLKRSVYSDQDPDLRVGTCVICLERYEEEDEVGTLGCGHDYHAGCVKKWLLVKNACPICKAPARADDDLRL